MLTMAQLEFLRDVQYPAALKLFARRIALLQDFSKQSEENARIAKEDIFGLQNSQKAITGYQSGLLDKSIMDTKAADEAKLRAAFKADPKNAGAADPWDEIAQAIKVQQSIYPNLTYLERMRGFSSHLATIARTLVRAAAEKPKPNQERMREFRDSDSAVLRATVVLNRTDLQESGHRSAHRLAQRDARRAGQRQLRCAESAAGKNALRMRRKI